VETIRLLHTADVHIGAPFEFLGPRGADQRETIRETFSRVVRKARDGEYDVLVIAGDLFDSAYGVSEGDLTFVIRALGGIGPGCRTVILPGSHDFWSAGTVFERERERFEKIDGVGILTPDVATIEFPDISLAVHGRALTSLSAGRGVMSGIVPNRAFRWNVAVAHGSVEGASAAGEYTDYPIYRDDLDEEFDYIALGHWHSYNEVRTGARPVVYSGSPELIARDQRGAGSVVSVVLSPAGTEIERVQVGRRKVVRARIDCTGLTTTEELMQRIVKDVPADGDLVLEVSLCGVIGADAWVDPELAADCLNDSYFSVRLAGGRPSRALSREELLEVPEETVAGRYVRDLLARIAGASEEEREKLEEALQLGYHLFRGRNPLE
jgi:exonuclease SbcD